VEAAAEILFGSRAPSSKSIARNPALPRNRKLIGSPSYLGRETHSLITQEAAGGAPSDKLKLSFLLFDEIEKAATPLAIVLACWTRQLTLATTAAWTFADRHLHDSNLAQVKSRADDGGYGFIKSDDKPKTNLDQKVERTALKQQAQVLPRIHERLDKLVVFHSLQREQLEQVLDIELGMVQQRVLDAANGKFLSASAIPAATSSCRRAPTSATARPSEARHRALRRLSAGQTCLPRSKCASATRPHRLDGQHKELTFVREQEAPSSPPSRWKGKRLPPSLAQTALAKMPRRSRRGDVSSRLLSRSYAARGGKPLQGRKKKTAERKTNCPLGAGALPPSAPFFIHS